MRKFLLVFLIICVMLGLRPLLFGEIYHDGDLHDPLEAADLEGGPIPADVYSILSNTSYVCKSGDDANKGGSIYSQKLTIQAAINACATSGGGLVRIGSGSYAEDVIVSNTVSLVGDSAQKTIITGMITIPSDYLGGLLKDVSIQAISTVGEQFVMEADMSTVFQVRLVNIAFVETALTSFTDSPIKILGGNCYFDSCSFVASSANFNGMGVASGNWMIITNDAKVKMLATAFDITSMQNTNVSFNIIQNFASNEIFIADSIVDVTFSGPCYGEIRWFADDSILAENSQHGIVRNHVHIIGDDDTCGEAEAVSASGGAVLRASGNDININGFAVNYSYEAYANSEIYINGADDIASDGQKENGGGVIRYTGSPQDSIYQIDGLRWGQNGQLWAGMPESPTLQGHNGTSFWNFCESKNATFGEAEIYNNATVEADGTVYTVVDSDSALMGMTLTMNGWADAKGDGEGSAGTLFPKSAVKSQFETTDDETGTVTLAGCEIGETYIWEILGSAKDAGKDCTDMTYWIVGGGTGTVAVVDNTDDLVTITNVAASTEMTLYCTSPNAGEDSFLNAIRISGPKGEGLDERYLRLDGQEPMSGDLQLISGTAEARVLITSDTAAAIILTTNDCRGVIRLNGDNDVIDYTLPDAEVGLVVTLANTLYDQIITVDPQAGDSIILIDGTVVTAGNAIDSSGAKNDKGTLLAIDAATWMLFSEQNTWTDGGAD